MISGRPCVRGKGLRASSFRINELRAASSGGALEEARCRRQVVTTCRGTGQRYNRGRGGGSRQPIARSDGQDHLGSSQQTEGRAPMPFPPAGTGPPIRVLPVGGLGEIGMNCMLVGVNDRYILIDAGLMFPDFSDLGMQKILPDTGFLAQWRDRIEALVITHGHEDHIGALPWVVPALDPATPIYAGGFPMQLVKRRLMEYNLWDEKRMHVMNMRRPFQCGPFELEPFRVTHSIPDCCGLVLRSEAGTVVHTGDWKIDENPVDGEVFDREFFEQLGHEGVTLFMSDSTNVLSPGRTTSERVVEDALARKVAGHQGKGRVITTQFASNLHRLAGVKKAADAAGRKVAFIGMSLHHYLEAAAREGRAPFDPRELVPASAIEDCNPNELLIVTTGSQGEPRAALNLAAREASHQLRLLPTDLLLYSAKIIPGNDTKVMSMMNRIAELGPEIAMSRDDNLHTSGHAYKGELEEVLRLVKPQHFLPVHGEYAFLCAHAQLARENGVHYTSVIRNGTMLGVADRRNARTHSIGSMSILGKARLTNFYNDGNKGTGSAEEMALDERQLLAVEGIVVAAVDVLRDPGAPASACDGGDAAHAEAAGAAALRRSLRAKIRVTTRAMWTDGGRILESMHAAAEDAVSRMPADASLGAVERAVADALRRTCKVRNNRRPDVLVIAHEADPRAGEAARASATRRLQEGLLRRQQLSAPSRDGDARGAQRPGAPGRMPAVPADARRAADAALAVRQRHSAAKAQREVDMLFAGKGGDPDELGAATSTDSSSEDEPVEEAELPKAEPKTRARAAGAAASKAAAGAAPRRTRKAAAPPPDTAPPGGPPLATRVPKGLLQKRKAANPRDTLQGDNVEYP